MAVVVGMVVIVVAAAMVVTLAMVAACRWKAATCRRDAQATKVATCVYMAAAAAVLAGAYRSAVASSPQARWWSAAEQALLGLVARCMSAAARLLVLASQEQCA